MRNRWWIALVLALVACSTGTSTDSPSPAPKTFVYSLVAPLSVSPSGLVARAVLPGGQKCPELEVTGATSVSMQQRSPGSTTKGTFDDVTVCSANIPAGASGVALNGEQIPAQMPRQVETVAAVADTGCLVRKFVQNCNSVKDWPFATIATQIDKAAPDLLIHVGDYFYREAACPTADSDRCGGSPAPPKDVPFLDSGAGWLADFFEPAEPMLATAPLLAVRGNHEICEIGGNGYFLFLDARPDSAATCAPVERDGRMVAPTVLSKTWSVDVPMISGRPLRLVVVDSAYGWDYGTSPWWPKLRPGYEAAAELAKDPGVDPWLVVHQPSLANTTVRYNPGNVPGWTPWVAVDQAAASHGLLKDFTAIVSGHLHLSQVVKVKGLPPQFVFGGGGTDLDPHQGYQQPEYGPLADSKGRPIVPGVKPYPKAAYRWLEVEHAFGLASPDPAQGSWQVRYVRPSGAGLTDCTVRADSPDCGS